jgi:hypothetical protein
MKRSILLGLAAFFALSLVASRSVARDGVIEINHASALAGGVTAADAPGYPVTITGPGSYLLTGPLTPPGSSDGIEITGSDVSLDLNGFSIRGTAVCSGSPTTSCTLHGGHGIVDLEDSSHGIVVRNGMVQGVDYGIRILASSARIENVTAIANATSGIFLGAFGSVRNCRAGLNRFTGIFTGPRSQVLENVSHGNGSGGITAQMGSIVRRNRTYLNAETGIAVYPPALVEHNVVEQNNTVGSSVFGGIFANSSSPGRVTIDANVMASNGVGDIVWFGSVGSPYFTTGTNVCTTNAC